MIGPVLYVLICSGWVVDVHLQYQLKRQVASHATGGKVHPSSKGRTGQRFGSTERRSCKVSLQHCWPVRTTLVIVLVPEGMLGSDILHELAGWWWKRLVVLFRACPGSKCRSGVCVVLVVFVYLHKEIKGTLTKVNQANGYFLPSIHEVNRCAPYYRAKATWGGF